MGCCQSCQNLCDKNSQITSEVNDEINNCKSNLKNKFTAKNLHKEVGESNVPKEEAEKLLDKDINNQEIPSMNMTIASKANKEESIQMKIIGSEVSTNKISEGPMNVKHQEINSGNGDNINTKINENANNFSTNIEENELRNSKTTNKFSKEFYEEFQKRFSKLEKYLDPSYDNSSNVMRNKLRQYRDIALKLKAESLETRIVRFTEDKYKIYKAKEQLKKLADDYEKLAHNKALKDILKKLISYISSKNNKEQSDKKATKEDQKEKTNDDANKIVEVNVDKEDELKKRIRNRAHDRLMKAKLRVSDMEQAKLEKRKKNLSDIADKAEKLGKVLFMNATKINTDNSEDNSLKKSENSKEIKTNNEETDNIINYKPVSNLGRKKGHKKNFSFA